MALYSIHFLSIMDKKRENNILLTMKVAVCYITLSQMTCGCSSVAEPQPSKLVVWVRFPSPAPFVFVPVAQLDRATDF